MSSSSCVGADSSRLTSTNSSSIAGTKKPRRAAGIIRGIALVEAMTKTAYPRRPDAKTSSGISIPTLDELPRLLVNRYPIFLMIETRGRKREMTMKPTTNPIPTISNGSSRLDIPSTATSTSAS